MSQNDDGLAILPGFLVGRGLSSAQNLKVNTVTSKLCEICKISSIAVVTTYAVTKQAVWMTLKHTY